MHIAIFGGRFDPIHNGHISVAREVLQIKTIKQVWLIPANTHPWKPMTASAQDRFAMVKLVEEKGIIAKDFDIARGGETYTIDTVRRLIADKTNTYYWVCGIDQIKDLYRWREYEELEHLITFLVFPRNGYDTKTNLPKNCQLISGDFVATDLSSSFIRQRVQKGLSISSFVPEKVEGYIVEKKLYQ